MWFLMVTAGFTIKIPIVKSKTAYGAGFNCLRKPFENKVIGWYTGRDSPNTRQLLAEFPQIQYDSDYYGDDLPFGQRLQTLRVHHALI